MLCCVVLCCVVLCCAVLCCAVLYCIVSLLLQIGLCYCYRLDCVTVGVLHHLQPILERCSHETFRTVRKVHTIARTESLTGNMSADI